jgi:hypothetical protein
MDTTGTYPGAASADDATTAKMAKKVNCIVEMESRTELYLYEHSANPM